MQKHGSDNFTLSVLCEGSESYVIELEAKAIEVYDSIISGYNILPAHHSDRLTVPREVVEKQKASVRRYYENNVSKNLGRSVEKRVDDKPLYVLGFWFPNLRTVKQVLSISTPAINRRVNKENGDMLFEKKKT